MIPCAERQKHVRAHQQKPFILRVRRAQSVQRVRREARAAAPNFHVRHEKAGVLFCRQAAHFEPIGGGRHRRFQLVRRDKGRHEQHPIQSQRIRDKLCRADVRRVDRIERAAEQCDPHARGSRSCGSFAGR